MSRWAPRKTLVLAGCLCWWDAGESKGAQGHRVHAYVTVHTDRESINSQARLFCPPIAIIPACNNVITHPHIHLILYSGYRLQRSFPLSPRSVPSLRSFCFALTCCNIQYSSCCIDLFLSIYGLRCFLQFVPRPTAPSLAAPVPHFIHTNTSIPSPSRTHTSLACAYSCQSLTHKPSVTAG